MAHCKTIIDINGAQGYHKIAKLYCKLAEVYEEEAENREIETIEIEDDSNKEMEE